MGLSTGYLFAAEIAVKIAHKWMKSSNVFDDKIKDIFNFLMMCKLWRDANKSVWSIYGIYKERRQDWLMNKMKLTQTGWQPAVSLFRANH